MIDPSDHLKHYSTFSYQLHCLAKIFLSSSIFLFNFSIFLFSYSILSFSSFIFLQISLYMSASEIWVGIRCNRISLAFLWLFSTILYLMVILPFPSILQFSFFLKHSQKSSSTLSNTLRMLSDSMASLRISSKHEKVNPSMSQWRISINNWPSSNLVVNTNSLEVSIALNIVGSVEPPSSIVQSSSCLGGEWGSSIIIILSQLLIKLRQKVYCQQIESLQSIIPFFIFLYVAWSILDGKYHSNIKPNFISFSWGDAGGIIFFPIGSRLCSRSLRKHAISSPLSQSSSSPYLPKSIWPSPLSTRPSPALPGATYSQLSAVCDIRTLHHSAGSSCSTKSHANCRLFVFCCAPIDLGIWMSSYCGALPTNRSQIQWAIIFDCIQGLIWSGYSDFFWLCSADYFYCLPPRRNSPSAGFRSRC